MPFKLTVMAAMLLGLPLVGIRLAGAPVGPYLEFPPATRPVAHAPFSWTAFAIYAGLILACTLPLVLRWLRVARRTPEPGKHRPLLWWGRAGLAAGAAAWVLAWSRFDWFAAFQAHTFLPLWLAYIVVVNALAFRRSGHCLIVDRPVHFLALFPLSALFWWFFEYLNRFVHNWHYTGVAFDPWAYAAHASLSFATVLPAVLGTRDWLLGASSLQRAFGCWRPVTCPHPKPAAAVALAAAGLGLTGIGVYPDQLFAAVWVAPAIIIAALQVLRNDRPLFVELRGGDWRPLISAAAAALVCGVFWEMWNFGSLARWEYSVPYVQRWALFEMPLLGYAG